MAIEEEFRRIQKDLSLHEATQKQKAAIKAQKKYDKLIKSMKDAYSKYPNTLWEIKAPIALGIFATTGLRNLAKNAEKVYGDRIAQVESNERFKQNKKPLFEYDQAKEKRMRAERGAVHNGESLVDYRGAKITNNGKIVVEYDHYNDKSNCCEFDLSESYMLGICSQEGIKIHIVDSFSIKLGPDHKIDWSLPENAEIIEKCPKGIAEVLRRYPESYATLPAHCAVRYPVEYVTAVKDGVQDKIAKGEIPPNEDGSHKTETDYKKETIDMIKGKNKEVSDYVEAAKEEAMKANLINEEFNELEGANGR